MYGSPSPVLVEQSENIYLTQMNGLSFNWTAFGTLLTSMYNLGFETERPAHKIWCPHKMNRIYLDIPIAIESKLDELLGFNHWFLCGSTAKNTTNLWSDIDIFATMQDITIPSSDKKFMEQNRISICYLPTFNSVNFSQEPHLWSKVATCLHRCELLTKKMNEIAAKALLETPKSKICLSLKRDGLAFTARHHPSALAETHRQWLIFHIAPILRMIAQSGLVSQPIDIRLTNVSDLCRNLERDLKVSKTLADDLKSDYAKYLEKNVLFCLKIITRCEIWTAK